MQDIFLTKTAEMADVVLPAARLVVRGARARSPTRERRVQRVRKALDPPGEARDDIWIICELARAPGPRLGRRRRAEEVWNELRTLSPMHGGMSYARLEALGGIQWPCPDEDASRLAVPARAAVGTSRVDGPPAPFSRRSSTTRRSRRSTPSTRCA